MSTTTLARQIKHIELTTIAVSVPVHKESNENLTWLTPAERSALQTATGIKERRVVKKERLVDLCLSAARCALEANHTPSNSIDLLVLVTQTSPLRIPSLVYVLQHELGLGQNCACMEVNWGCAGYVYGLWLAGGLLQPGGTALLLAGDLSTPLLAKEDRSTVPLFSDAVSATLLKYRRGAAPWHVYLGSDGSQHAHIQLQAEKSSKNEYLHMDGMAVFHFALQRVLPHLQEVLRTGPWRAEEIDYVVCHQASRIVNEALRERLKLPAIKFPYSLASWGNTSSATIPMTLLTELAAPLASRPQRLLLCGFGTGLAWGSLLMESQPMQLCPVQLCQT